MWNLPTLINFVLVGGGVVVPKSDNFLDLLEALQQVVQRFPGFQPRQRRVHGLDARAQEAERVRRDGVAHLFELRGGQNGSLAELMGDKL